MRRIVVQPTSLAEWYALVNDAEVRLDLCLNVELESYLVYLLMRFAKRPEWVKSILAMEFLESLNTTGSLRTDRLQEVGDKCLLFSGLFPGIAKRRRVQESYFIDLGQNAFYVLADLSSQHLSELYLGISQRFVIMRNVLQAMRSNANVTTLVIDNPESMFEIVSPSRNGAAIPDKKKLPH